MGFLDEVKKRQAAESTAANGRTAPMSDVGLPHITPDVANCLTMLNGWP
jgi:hypothetical protein